MSRPAPLMESRKVLAAARPPAGVGTPTAEVLRALPVTRPPASVLVGFVLAALAPLGLLAAAVVIVVQMSSYGGWYIKFFMVAFTAIALLLAGLAWSGTKRTVHVGEYDGALFIARLATAFCVVAAAAGAKLAFIDGDDVPWTFALPFVGTAVLWLPALAFALPSAKGWPDQVLLNRGLRVRDEVEAQLLLMARPHGCGHTQPLGRHPLVPVADRAGRGWGADQPCAGCRRPLGSLFRLVPADRASDAGGGDRMWLVLSHDETLNADDLAGRSTVDLSRLREVAAVAARCAEELLDSIPAGRDAVPWRGQRGRVLDIRVPTTVWGRAPITEQLTRWRSLLGRVEAELVGRAGQQ